MIDKNTEKKIEKKIEKCMKMADTCENDVRVWIIPVLPL